jgi:GNAT superfamily N-acetyltransferase
MGWICDTKEAAKKLAQAVKTFGNGGMDNFAVEFKRNPFSVKMDFKDSVGKSMATFTLKEMINCCGILVSTRTEVSNDYRGKGLAQELMLLKEELARQYGYSCMMATVNMTGNPAEVHILEKFGWKCVNDFNNSRTKNKVGVFVKNL